MANRKKCLNKCFFKWFDSCALFRGLIVQIIRLRLGHSITPLYLHKIGLRERVLYACATREKSVISTTSSLGVKELKSKSINFFNQPTIC